MEYTHVSHHKCFTKNIFEFIDKNLDRLIQQSIVIDKVDNFTVLQYIEDNSPLGLRIVIQDDQLIDVYPISLEMIVKEIELDEIIILDEAKQYAAITCYVYEYDTIKLTFYDRDFAINKDKYKKDGIYTFGFYGIAYNLYASDLQTNNVKIGNKIVEFKNGIISSKKEDMQIDDSTFHSCIYSENKDNFFNKSHFLNQNVYDVVFKIANGHAEPDTFLPIYAFEDNIDNIANVKKSNYLAADVWVCGVLQ